MWPFSSPYPELGLYQVCEEYDYIIVGGGTAGCVLANRLSADKSVTVLLIERGVAEDTWVSRVPLLSMDFVLPGSMSSSQDSLPQGFVDGRKQKLFYAKVLGGTSRINSTVYARGLAAEYNAWSTSGRKGWSYDEVLPLFMKSECCLDRPTGEERGLLGEWTTRYSSGSPGTFSQTTERIIKAAKKLGFPFIEDVNSSTSPALGCGRTAFTVDSKGRRQSTFSAFLPGKLVQERKQHLHVCTGTLVTKIHIVRDVSGTNIAKGVYVRPTFEASPTIRIGARREVILCSGTLGSPKLLQLSGVGPRELLESLDIPVMKHLPAVGTYLQDHLAVPLVFSVPMEDSLVGIERQFLTFAQELAKYVTLGTGLLSFPVFGLDIFARTDLLDSQSHLRCSTPQLDSHTPENRPDIKITPIAHDATGLVFNDGKGSFTLLNVLVHPESTGTVRITSTNTDVPVDCDLGSLSHPNDWKALRASLRLSIALSREMQARGYPLEPLYVPPEDSDLALDSYIKKWSMTTYNYSSTCRMAPESDSSPGVVDDELRVHGICGLRVADSSTFPQIIGSHLQAPSVMVAEKCAELITGSYAGCSEIHTYMPSDFTD